MAEEKTYKLLLLVKVDPEHIDDWAILEEYVKMMVESQEIVEVLHIVGEEREVADFTEEVDRLIDFLEIDTREDEDEQERDVY